MPLHLKCPLCKQTAVVPDAAINRRVECGSCHATHHVRDIVHRHEPPAGLDASAGEGMARGDKLLLAWCCGVPAALLLVFLVYWFGFRDTWELDNYMRIMQQCDAVERALAQSDAAAAEAYATGGMNGYNVEAVSMPLCATSLPPEIAASWKPHCWHAT